MNLNMSSEVVSQFKARFITLFQMLLGILLLFGVIKGFQVSNDLSWGLQLLCWPVLLVGGLLCSVIMMMALGTSKKDDGVKLFHPPTDKKLLRCLFHILDAFSFILAISVAIFVGLCSISYWS